MKKCRIEVRKISKDKASEIIYQGIADIDESNKRIEYLENQTQVSMMIDQGCMRIVRENASKMELYFELGKIKQGIWQHEFGTTLIDIKTNLYEYEANKIQLKYNILVENEIIEECWFEWLIEENGYE